MQQIFFNAKVFTGNNDNLSAEAFLVNDESIVFVGSDDEVLGMKTEETVCVDLKNNHVYPSFFALNVNVFDLIEQRLKNAKKEKYIENNDNIDENYEIFCNFDIYKKEFLNLQKQFLKAGITTIQELYLSAKEFVFWKKLAEEKLLDIDVVGYVDIKSSKQVMDDNCRSYRKYKNGFRLGGYALAIDGSVSEKKAWLKKTYKKEHGYVGYSEYFDEQLSFLIKTALEEKKQLVVETNGDRAVEQFLRCFEEVVEKEKFEDVLRPIALNCNVLSAKQISKMKKLGVTPLFNVFDLIEKKNELKQAVGSLRAKKLQPLHDVEKAQLKLVFSSHEDFFKNGFDMVEFFNQNEKKLSKHQKLNVDEVLSNHLKNSAYIVFDQEQKGSIENGKQATFLVVDKNKNIKDVYVKGNKIKK